MDKLEKIVKLLEDIKFELEEMRKTYVAINYSLNPICEGNCKFPTVWYGIYPPPCQTCGKSAYEFTITN